MARRIPAPSDMVALHESRCAAETSSLLDKIASHMTGFSDPRRITVKVTVPPTSQASLTESFRASGWNLEFGSEEVTLTAL